MIVDRVYLEIPRVILLCGWAHSSLVKSIALFM